MYKGSSVNTKGGLLNQKVRTRFCLQLILLPIIPGVKRVCKSFNRRKVRGEGYKVL